MQLVYCNIADHIIGIDIHYQSTYRLFSDFIDKQSGRPEFIVSCSDNDFEEEMNNYSYTQEAYTLNRIRLEPLILHRKIAEALIPSGIVLMHGVVLRCEGKTHMFCGPSGVGKSTHMMLWQKNRHETTIINGDKPFIITFEDKNTVMACGTPWSGKECLHTNDIVKLDNIVFMNRSDCNAIRSISSTEALQYLLAQTYYPRDIIKRKDTMKYLYRVMNSVRFYVFDFNNYQDDCFSTVYSALYA